MAKWQRPTEPEHTEDLVDLDPQVVQLGTQLGEVTVRNTVGAVWNRIRAVKARSDQEETIRELEQVVNHLLEDREELVSISRSYREYISAQEISEEDLSFISDTLLPRLTQIAEQTGTGTAQVEELMAVLEPLLAVETIKVMQLLGFNFRRAVGESLTELVSGWINSRTPRSPSADAELLRAQLANQTALAAVVTDEKAFERWKSLFGTT
jgi:hypothetical protein